MTIVLKKPMIEELAELVLDFVTKKISKEDIAEHFRSTVVRSKFSG